MPAPIGKGLAFTIRCDIAEYDALEVKSMSLIEFLQGRFNCRRATAVRYIDWHIAQEASFVAKGVAAQAAVDEAELERLLRELSRLLVANRLGPKAQHACNRACFFLSQAINQHRIYNADRKAGRVL